jgi:hypothetical protein
MQSPPNLLCILIATPIFPLFHSTMEADYYVRDCGFKKRNRPFLREVRLASMIVLEAIGHINFIILPIF